MAWLRRVCPGFVERVEKSIVTKHRYKRIGKGASSRIIITKNLKKCKCGKQIDQPIYTKCHKCLKAFHDTPRGRLAERAAIPDRVYYPRYEVAT
jgi:hypothetical protein